MLRFAVRASTLTTWIALSAGEPTGMAYWWARSRSVCGSVWFRDRSLLEWCTPREAWPCVPPYCKWWIAVPGNVVLIDNRNGDAFVVARYVLSLQISVWIDLHLLNKQLCLDLCSFGQRALCSGHLWVHIWQPYTDKELLFGGVKKPLTVSCGTSTLRSVFTNLLCFSYNCCSSPEEGRMLHCSPITHKFGLAHLVESNSKGESLWVTLMRVFCFFWAGEANWFLTRWEVHGNLQQPWAQQPSWHSGIFFDSCSSQIIYVFD